MKIIIPMAGKGKRYNDAAFYGPKPLVEIDGRPMIEHVVNLFSPDDEFIFICNEEHLQTTPMREVLSNLAPKQKIISVTNEQIIGGPIYTCKNVFNLIDDEEEVIINYCDFTMKWNYRHFLQTVRASSCVGAIPSFRGFHPASLGDTYYAYMKINKDHQVTELREKEPFSNDRLEDHASTGTYYFKKGSIFKKYAEKVMELGMNAKGEAYITLPYILMINEGLSVLCYEVDKFICWGTPRDYETYKFWSEFFFKRAGQIVGFNNVNIKTTNVFPLASDKRDFKDLGFDAPNFLIPLLNRPLLNSTVTSYPKGIRNIFICLQEHEQQYKIKDLLQKVFHQPEIIFLEQKTAGNSATILKAEDRIEENSAVCVSGNTYLLDYDERRLSHLLEKQEIDVVLLSFTHHECILRDPTNHSYLKIRDGQVEQICEKTTISDHPDRDEAFTGTAIYRRAADLFRSIKKNRTLVNEEGYTSFTANSFLTAINELIKEGKRVVTFEVDKFIPLFSPTDYQELVYWQEYFDSLPYHPYSKMVH